MQFKRIHITGASGSGTSTLGAALSAHLKYAWFDADDYFWEPTQPPFQVKRNKEERLSMLLDNLSQSKASVLSGSICNWDLTLEDSFDFIIYLHVPQEIRLARLRAREIVRYGSINDDFISWAAQYDEGRLTVRSRKLHDEWLNRRRCKVLRIESDIRVEELLAIVMENISGTGRNR